MGFIDTSVITAPTISKGATAVAIAQQSVTTTVPTPSPSVSTSITTTVVGTNGGLSSVSALTNNTNSLQATATKVVTAVATSYLQSALKSITSTFSGSKTSLASGISPVLASIFNNTNVKTASTTPTLISDPVFTNLLSAKTPSASAFKFDSAQAGSQAVTVAGSTSVFGSGSASMTGTTLSTLLNRLNLNSTSNLNTALTSSLAGSQVNSLFSTLSKDTGIIVSGAVGGGTAGALLSQATTLAVSSALGVPTTTTSSANSLNSFLGHTSDVSTALGGQNLSSYYVNNSSISLVNQDGVSVSTNQSGVDATIANAILSVIGLAGCTAPNTNYNSASEIASLFNLALGLSAKNGMSTEVNSLLGCSHARTTLGQQSLVSAFTSSANSQIDISSTILTGIDAPSTLNTNYVSASILTNPYLNERDIPTVNSMFTTMGTSTTAALTIPAASSPGYPVVDGSLLAATSPTFANGIFGNTTMTDYLNGSEMLVQPDGSFSI